METHMNSIIESNIRKTIQTLKKQGTTGMSMSNLIQVTPTPPADMATDENISNYDRVFREIAQKVMAEVDFEITDTQ